MVSVIVPVYNAEYYLEECINSLLNQTYHDLEIILIDDGSSDRSASICEKFAKIDKRVIVIHNKNRGPGATRNLGIKYANGEYIGFVDSDDTVDSNMYCEMVKAANKFDVNMVMCPYNIISSGLIEIISSPLPTNSLISYKTIQTIVLPEIIGKGRYGYASLCNKIYRRCFLIDNHLLIDEVRYHGEDWWFNIQSFEKLDAFIIVSDPLYNYVQQNSSSLMKKYDVNKIDIYLQGYWQCRQICNRYCIDFVEAQKNYLLQAYNYIDGVVAYEQRPSDYVKKVFDLPETMECYQAASKYVPFNIRLFFQIGFLLGSNICVYTMEHIRILKNCLRKHDHKNIR